MVKSPRKSSAVPRRAASARAVVSRSRSRRFLTVDIGGSGLKAAVVDRSGRMLTQRLRVKTPRRPSPGVLVNSLVELVKPLGRYDKVSVGFPGVVRAGRIITAPNLGTDLEGFALAAALTRRLGRPVRVANDAEIQGAAAITGKGIELVITLGTGFGSAIFHDGHALPVLELGHHPFLGGKSYEDHLGRKALEKRGKKKWNRRLKRALKTLKALFHYDRLYIGGGHARQIDFKIDRDTCIISNHMGVKGGPALWSS